MLSVDLFTGIGGFVLGLDGVCKPIVYCDNSPLVLRTLDRLMLEGAVPKATVVNDVTKLQDILRAVGSRKVDVVTAGFPCVGFSDFGRKEGLGDARSGLFRDAMKVVTALRPKLVFFENVHRIVNSNRGRDFKVIMDALHEAGYDCRWTTCKASDVGIPMKRKRWFCLCIRRGVDDVSAIKVETDSRKSVRRPMPKLLENRAPDYAERYSLLGNSIVPAVARFAFERLISGEVGVPSRIPTLHGFCVNGKVRWVKVKSAPEPPYEIILDPRHYAPAYTPKNIPNRATPVESPVAIRSWPTPRATAPRHSNSLSVRNIRDLPTAALFASKVQGVRQPRAIQGNTVNPVFVEWLMGFPKNHTKNPVRI
jgi:hypothetical protein